MKITRIYFLLISLFFLFLSINAFAWDNTEPLIVDHACTDLSQIPEESVEKAKTDLHIAYGHTSHGSQLITGMSGLIDFKGELYTFSKGGGNGSLDLRDRPFSGASDLGNPNRTAWESATRNYLNDHSDTNVIISALHSRNGQSNRLLFHCLKGDVAFSVTPLLLWEYIVLGRYAGKFKVLAKVETYDQQDFLEVYAT